MPYYFIDFQDGNDLQRDEDGYEMENFEQARAETNALLSQVAKEQLLNDEHRTFTVTLRNGEAIAIYRATLTFQAEHLAS